MQQGILKIRAELLAPFAAASDVYKSEVDELIKVHGEHEYVLMKVHQKQTNGAAGDAGGKPANNGQDPVDPVDPGADRVEPLTFESKEEFEDSCGEIVVETESAVAGASILVAKDGTVCLAQAKSAKEVKTIPPRTHIGGFGGGSMKKVGEPADGGEDRQRGIDYCFPQGDKSLIELEETSSGTSFKVVTLYGAIREIESSGRPNVSVSYLQVEHQTEGGRDTLLVTPSAQAMRFVFKEEGARAKWSAKTAFGAKTNNPIFEGGLSKQKFLVQAFRFRLEKVATNLKPTKAYVVSACAIDVPAAGKLIRV